jgi:hypothetical protein
MLHWNGRRWRLVSTPPGILSLGDIVMHSAASGWAVGSTADYRPVVLRWNGRTWRKQILLRPPREGGLYSLAAVSPRDVWAVGYTGGEFSINTIDAFAVHWNGKTWHAVPAPARGDDGDLGTELNDEFVDVAAVSATEAWAIHGANVRDDLQRWDGRHWRIVRVFGRNTHLSGVLAFRGQAWVLGSRAGHPFLLNRTRDGWRVAGRELAGLQGGLIGASALSPSQIWAGGSRLLARYAC